MEFHDGSFVGIVWAVKEEVFDGLTVSIMPGQFTQ